MARPRDLSPSPIALRRRAERAQRAEGSERTPPVVAGDDQPHEDAPEISSDASTEEAVRLRSVYDARKSRLASLAEGLRLDIERGKLRTRAWVVARDEEWNRAAEDRLDLVERLLDPIDGITIDQRRAFLDASRAWRLETRRILASLRA